GRDARRLAGGRATVRPARGRDRPCALAARPARGADPHGRRPAPGADVHDAALPGRCRDQPADHRRHRSQVRYGRVQGHRDSYRAARGLTTALKTGGPSATEAERAAIDAVVVDGARRDLVLPALHAAQTRVGWVSRGALNYISGRLQVPPAELWGIVTFYHLLSTRPQPPVIAHVCYDLACRIRA